MLFEKVGTQKWIMGPYLGTQTVINGVIMEGADIKKPTTKSDCGLPLPLLDLNQRPSD
jgi:hypothetical protein